MSDSQPITLYPALLAAIAAVVVGFATIWSNPQRTINRFFFSASLHVALWLGCLYLAVISVTVTSINGLFWLRMTTGVGTLVALHLWLIKEAIVRGDESLAVTLRRGRWWALATTLLALLCFTDWFIPGKTTHRTAEMQVYGLGYYAFIIGLVMLYGLLCRETVLQMRAQKGVARLELQVLLLGGTAVGSAILLLMAMRALLALPVLIRLQPLVILAFYTATVIAITTYRIFDARQILLLGLEKSVLIVAVACAAYALDWGLGSVLPEPFGWLVTTALSLWLAVTLNRWLDRMFHFYPQATEARQAAFDVARREMRIESLEKAFLGILKGWGQTEHALIVAGSAGSLRGGGLEIAEDCAAVQALRQLRWATPERLTRQRSTPEREALGRFLTEHGLGALVIGEGPTLTALVGVGIAASRQPFTYPQVTQLMELSSIIESALERAHFSVKAQRAEQLATVGLLGASLAHEIRNPLVSIKAFVQLLPQHYQDPAFREKFFRLIGDEVMRIDRLTEQLLDLASPRVYAAQMIELHPVLRSSLELVAAKATDKRIQFLTDFKAAPDRVFTDASAAKQVLLNLCFNAIQAVELHEGERWIKIATRNVEDGLEVRLEDSGPGIPPEIRPRLFQPFQSTKSSGFGLGLAICSDILAGLDATITVDPAVPGRGATFRIVFPCQA